MPEKNARFLFTFSTEATAELMAGTVSLSSGGLRKPDGTILELAKPVMIDSADIAQVSHQAEDNSLKSRLRAVNHNLDQILSDNHALSQIAWMNYALNCKTYEMTYQGFQSVIGRLDTISAQISNLQTHLQSKDFNDTLEQNVKYKNNLRTIAGAMETKSFNTSLAALRIEPMINEIQAYFERLFSELKTGSKSDQLVLGSIVFLLAPYCYVVRKYSSLYFYENKMYPSNYDAWKKIISAIISGPKFKQRMQYFLRVNSELNLEDILIARKKVLFNLRATAYQIDFDHRYVACHSKEQYLSINNQLAEKIETKDYTFLDGHLLIELD